MSGEEATAGRGGVIDASIGTRRAFLVMGSPGGARRVWVLLDGKPYRTVKVRRQTIYPLVDLPRAEQHRLTLRFDAGCPATRSRSASGRTERGRRDRILCRVLDPHSY